MLQKSLLFSIVCAAIIPFTTFASEQATLHFDNQTTLVPAETGWPSRAHITVAGKSYDICSHGFDAPGWCSSETTLTVPAKQEVEINIVWWQFGNAGKTFEPNCQHQRIIFKEGETKTFTMQGIPSNNIDDYSKIACSIS